MIRYFVTGASGFIGRHLCRALVEQGRTVTALLRSDSSAEGLPSEVRVVRASFDRPDVYGPALAECDYVVHLAADARFGDGPGYAAANVGTTAALLKAVAASAPGLRRLVFVSTMGAVDRARADDCSAALTEDSPPHPTSDYGRSKLEAERLVAASGLPYAVVRPSMVAGADMRANSHVAVFARLAAAGSLFSRARWPGRVSVIHVSDLARGLIVAAEHAEAAGRTFFAGGEPVSLGEIFDYAAPGRARVGLGWLAALSRPFAVALPFQAKALLHSALAVDDGALRRLGWTPRRAWRQAIDEVCERERRRLDPALPPPGRAVVTGAASGLGRALAEALARRGRRLLLVDRDAAGLEAVCPGRPHVERARCDLSDESALGTLLASPVWSREAIDEVFACAGLGLRGAVAVLPYSGQADIYRVNLLSRLQLVHHALRAMRARQFGRIVLISSSSAYQALPFMTVYAASNAALLLFGEGLASETREDGIEVLTVCPGGMRTRFQKSAGVQELRDEKLMEPGEVADLILRALGRDRRVIMPSFRSKAMAALARILPRRVSVALWHRLMARLR
ncbi:MAG: SDR family NAD(P)-dependent oxidoreductase [Elusimicrobia bacterium]|nr:SDR family NAD(P)-dependent oxidoreductase [Elusimicrobiota bacterium]